MSRLHDDDWLDSMSAAARYSISVYMLANWRRWSGFPENAVRRHGPLNFWNVHLIDGWLASRPKSKHGPEPRWRSVVEASLA
jgi:hypothetical protein